MQNKPYTPDTVDVSFSLEENYELWKNRQLIADVVRTLIQKQAVNDAYAFRMKAFDPLSSNTQPNVKNRKSSGNNTYFDSIDQQYYPLVKLQCQKIMFDKYLKQEGIQENLYHVVIRLVSWSSKSSGLNPSDVIMVWDDCSKDMTGQMPVNHVQLYDMHFEIIDENLSDGVALVCSGKTSISNVLGFRLGTSVEINNIPLYNNGEEIGLLSVVLMADFIVDMPKHKVDPKELSLYEINTMSSVITPITTAFDAIEQKRLPPVPRESALQQEITDQSSLVSKLRGDGKDFVSLLVGDVTLEDIKKTKTKIGANIAGV